MTHGESYKVFGIRVDIFLGIHMLLVLLTILLASILRGHLADCLIEDHPAKVLLLFALVLGVIWATERIVGSGYSSRKRQAVWVLFSVLVWLSILFLILNEYQCPKWFEARGHDERFLWFLVPLVCTLVIMDTFQKAESGKPITVAQSASSGSEDSDEIPPHLIKRWGQAVALAIMLLAMFFLALEYKQESGFAVKWPEIPAILMVFLLAELGVHLVVNAKAIGNQVGRATETASRAVENANEVSERTQRAMEASQQSMQVAVQVAGSTMTNLMSQAQGVFGSLEETSKKLEQFTTDVIGAGTKLWRDSGPKFRRAVGLSQDKFWEDMDQFTKDWTPKSEANGERRHELVRVLFDNFIGSDDSGSVQSTTDAVSCVTLDSVYAEASVQWLEAISKKAEETKEKEEVIVWAVSSLLPTDFALPSIWWNNRGQADRTKALKRFVDAVIDQTTKEAGEYQRITVFRKDDIRMRIWEQKLPNTLENWFLWDPRVPDNRLSNGADVRHNSTVIIRNIWKRKHGNDPIDETNKDISWEEIENRFEEIPGKYDELDAQIIRRYRILPEIAEDSSALFYVYEHSSNVHEAEDLGARSVLGANKGALDTDVTLDELRAVNMDETYIRKLEKLVPNQSSFSIRNVLSVFGWRSIKEWYCRYMQYVPSNSDDGGWWAIVEKDDFLSPLKVKWGAYEVLTPDLLLIGTQPPTGKVNWHGAAISNISFEHTECSVRLVTNRLELERIEKVVRMLANDFTPAPGNKEYVNNHGRWMKSMPNVRVEHPQPDKPG